ncbi:Glycoside hydrolase, 38 vacuolar alpha mannosidase [Dimargaris cristalligena]|nr:Glycoside hydrolase, 38 vacuolar alpha mannosidase [Dimargaris cristalligena]
MPMLKHRDITRNRFGKFLATGQFAEVSLFHVLTTKRENRHHYVKLRSYSVPDLQRISFAEAMKAEFKPAKIGDSFGPTWSTHWFEVKVTIPEDWVNEEVEFRWDADCEGLLWSKDGVPIHGLITGSRVEYILTRKSVGGEHFYFYIEMACNGLFGAGEGGLINPPNPHRSYRLDRAELAANNPAARELWCDFEIIRGMVDHLPAESPRGAQALATANTICNMFDRDDPTASIAACRSLSQAFLKVAGSDAGGPSATPGPSVHRITAVGNCHIDTAWLWPFAETKRKVARSWSTQLRLMADYPGYTFAASQAQQFRWLAEDYPEVFHQVQQAAKLGQFIPIGGTWVEMDCNLPGGEALVRQFLFGQRLFEQSFGQRCRVFWLPDTFGYAAQLPQLVRLADMKYFFTQKLSWNNINKFPNTTFYWIGLDGSKVLTHMAPSETYAAQVTVGEVIDSVQKHKDLAYTNESMLLYGDGDGGGGPRPAMLQRLQRLKNIDGLPRVEYGSPNDFYERVEKESTDLVSWKGELYFELHRGTYTSQAATKRGNRTSEFLMREVEALATIGWTLAEMAKNLKSPSGAVALTDYTYPQKEINQLWELLLLNQFHDVLPGSSIEIVYKDASDNYARIAAEGGQLIQKALQALYGSSLDRETKLEDGQAQGIMVFNSLPWRRTDVIEVPIGETLTDVQQLSVSKASAFVLADHLPPFSTQVLDPTKEAADLVAVSAYRHKDGNFILENIHIYATFDPQGRLISLLDRKLERELIPEGQRANQLRIYEDIPIYWDAWDVEIYHQEKGRDAGPGQVTVGEEGPLLGSLTVKCQLTPTSTCQTTISLTAVSRRLDFDCSVDWHENRRILKVEFPLDITSDVATYETQFGWVQRPTHYNTTWDMAKFEVCGHKFADLSEYGYGVALLNDCKYGYSTYRNTMRLSLLRAPKAPDAHCDMGKHQFRYALYPHKGTFFESDVVREAYQFNVPLLNRVVPQPDTASASTATPDTGLVARMAQPLFQWTGDGNIMVDTIKKAEDSGAIIVRLYEAYGGQGRGHLSSLLTLERAHLCNILEDHLEAVTIDPKRGIPLALKPFQVVTVKVTWQP